MYLKSPDDHDMRVPFTEIARFEPFAASPGTGVTVATTSTVSGADLLVSGSSADGTVVTLNRYALARPDANARTLAPTLLGTVESTPRGRAGSLGGS